ncbi:MAG: hypothetical protein EXS13_08800 [Planctomycetes bacterium]|nr:hypothetical protein [Planctomycetota bacterium]
MNGTGLFGGSACPRRNLVPLRALPVLLVALVLLALLVLLPLVPRRDGLRGAGMVIQPGSRSRY